MLYTGKYRAFSRQIVVAGLLFGNIVYADGTLKNDNDMDKTEMEIKQSQESVNLGTVTVLGEVTDYIGIPIGLSKGDVGKSTINQAQMDVLQANNMASVIDKVPGATMTGSPRPGGQVINIWGMKDSKNVPITVDGALKTFDKYQQGNLYVDPDLIKQVTVNKGAFIPEVGNGGFGGSVQLQTKDATDFLREGEQVGIFGKYGFHTNNDQHNYSAGIFGQTDNEVLDGLFYFSRTAAKDIRLADETRYRGSAMQQNSYLVKANFRPTKESKLTLTLADTRYKGWMPFAAISKNTINVASDDEYEWKRRVFYRDQRDKTYSLTGEYNPIDNPWLNLKGEIAYSETKQHDQKIAPRPGQKPPSISIATFGKENWFTFKNTNIHLRNNSEFKVGSIGHNLLVGVQYQRKKQQGIIFHDAGDYGGPDFNYGYFAPLQMAPGRQTVTSLYINDDIKIGEFTITPSLRFDHVKNEAFARVPGYSSTDPKDKHDFRSVNYQGFTPRLGVYWQSNETAALFADYTHGWQAPTVDEMYTVQRKDTSGPNGTSRELRKERLKALRVGGMLNFNNIFDEYDQLTLSATMFKNKVSDEVVRKIGGEYCEAGRGGNKRDCPKPMSAYHNGPGYTIKGIELEAKYDSEYIFGSLSASMLKGERIGSPRDIWFEKNTWMRDIPPRELRATLGFNIPSMNFSAGWQGKFVRKQDRTPSVTDSDAKAWSFKTTSGYAVHGVFMSYAPKGSYGPKFHLTIDNIFNKAYAPYLNDQIESPGIDLRLSVSYQF